MSWKNPGKVQARTHGTKLPNRSEALRFIASAKSPAFPGFFSRQLASRHLNLSGYSSHLWVLSWLLMLSLRFSFLPATPPPPPQPPSSLSHASSWRNVLPSSQLFASKYVHICRLQCTIVSPSMITFPFTVPLKGSKRNFEVHPGLPTPEFVLSQLFVTIEFAIGYRKVEYACDCTGILLSWRFV